MTQISLCKDILQATRISHQFGVFLCLSTLRLCPFVLTPAFKALSKTLQGTALKHKTLFLMVKKKWEIFSDIMSLSHVLWAGMLMRKDRGTPAPHTGSPSNRNVKT